MFTAEVYITIQHNFLNSMEMGTLKTGISYTNIEREQSKMKLNKMSK